MDIGLVIPIQDPDGIYKTSTELAYEAINAGALSADEWTTAHTAFVGGGMAARRLSFILVPEVETASWPKATIFGVADPASSVEQSSASQQYRYCREVDPSRPDRSNVDRHC